MKDADVFNFAELTRSGDGIIDDALPRESAESEVQAEEF
jgi:hypothetical protein